MTQTPAFIVVEHVTIPADGEWCFGCGVQTSDYARVRTLDDAGAVVQPWAAMWLCSCCREPKGAAAALRYLGAQRVQAEAWGTDERWCTALAR